MGLKDKDARAAYALAYRIANRITAKAYADAYRATHKEKARLYAAAYAIAKPVEIRVTKIAYRSRKRDELQQTPEYRAKIARHTMAKPRRNQELTTSKWKRIRLQVLARDGYTCTYCGQDAEQVDHIVARAHGGAHYDLDNLQACCKTCNHDKGTRSEAAFLAGRSAPLVFASVNLREQTTTIKPDSPFSAALEIETK